MRSQASVRAKREHLLMLPQANTKKLNNEPEPVNLPAGRQVPPLPHKQADWLHSAYLF